MLVARALPPEQEGEVVPGEEEISTHITLSEDAYRSCAVAIARRMTQTKSDAKVL